ncbi:MAG: DDE-type integrase/transposase/recombinase, partial [Spirochaetota bacterium]
MSSHNVYHTEFKIACSLGLLDARELSYIPRSSRYRFCHSDYSHLVGSDLSALLHQNCDLITELVQSKKALAACKAIISIKHTLVSIHSSFTSGIHALANTHRHVMESVVSAIIRVEPILGVEKAALLCGISRSTFFSWRTIISHYCTDSPSGRCIRRWPNQLRFDTIQTMKQLCSDPALRGWPLSSIAYFSRRIGIVQASLVSWYKYSRLFGFSTVAPRCRKKTRIGVRALSPNQIWHADVTLFRTLDGIVHYVYLVMDNYSRRILSWDISDHLSAHIRLSTIRKAWFSSQHMIT